MKEKTAKCEHRIGKNTSGTSKQIRLLCKLSKYSGFGQLLLWFVCTDMCGSSVFQKCWIELDLKWQQRKKNVPDRARGKT